MFANLLIYRNNICIIIIYMLVHTRRVLDLINIKTILETIEKMGPAIYPLAYGAMAYLAILIILIVYYFILYIVKTISDISK